MFRSVAAVAACFAALVLLGAAPTGALYVTTLPSGSDVWVDGTYVGHSPLVLDALAAGRHSLSLTKTGWLPQDLDVSIVAGGTALTSVQLQRALSHGVKPGPGTFAIKGMAASDVSVDGVAVQPQKNGTYVAPAGTHEIVARVAAGKVTRTVTIYPDMRTDVVLRDDDAYRSPVVAPADDYLGASDLRIEGDRIAIKHGGHDVAARLGSTTYKVDGRSVDFDSAPTLIGTRLYLPLELLTQLTTNDPKAK